MKSGKNSVLVEVFFYGIATAINRGLVIIALPFLGKQLTIEDFGIWSLSQILISLGAPFLTLNGSAGILREGADNLKIGYAYYLRFLKLLLIISLPIGIMAFWFAEDWIFYTVILIVLEGVISLLISWYRIQDKHLLYFMLISTKLVAIFTAIYINSLAKQQSLQIILFYQSLVGAILVLPFLFVEGFTASQTIYKEKFNAVITFCIFLLPHGFAQWILSGSDRIIIKFFLGDSQLGYYTLAYTLAMVVMLVNSGLGMTIPIDMIRNYQKWENSNRRLVGISIYSILFLVISVFIFAGSIILKPYVDFLQNLDLTILKMLPWLLNGMYFLGLYTFYINYLFYHRMSIVVTTITTVAAIFSIILTILLVKFIGIEGAAISTFVSYFVYLIGSLLAVSKYVKLKIRSLLDLGVIGSTVILNQILLYIILLTFE